MIILLCVCLEYGGVVLFIVVLAVGEILVYFASV